VDNCITAACSASSHSHKPAPRGSGRHGHKRHNVTTSPGQPPAKPGEPAAPCVRRHKIGLRGPRAQRDWMKAPEIVGLRKLDLESCLAENEGHIGSHWIILIRADVAAPVPGARKATLVGVDRDSGKIDTATRVPGINGRAAYQKWLSLC